MASHVEARNWGDFMPRDLVQGWPKPISSLIRVLVTCEGFRLTYGHWPTRLRLMRWQSDAYEKFTLTPLGWKVLKSKLKVTRLTHCKAKPQPVQVGLFDDTEPEDRAVLEVLDGEGNLLKYGQALKMRPDGYYTPPPQPASLWLFDGWDLCDWVAWPPHANYAPNRMHWKDWERDFERRLATMEDQPRVATS